MEYNSDRGPAPGSSEFTPTMHVDELREILREILDQELGISETRLEGRWEGGTLVLQPGDSTAKPKEIPLESFFHKIVMVRDRLRVLEAKVNAHPKLTDEDKVELQQYVTRIYGSLTSFNVLFKSKDEHFSGTGGGA